MTVRSLVLSAQWDGLLIEGWLHLWNLVPMFDPEIFSAQSKFLHQNIKLLSEIFVSTLPESSIYFSEIGITSFHFVLPSI
jgi:hypothetical protein